MTLTNTNLEPNLVNGFKNLNNYDFELKNKFEDNELSPLERSITEIQKSIEWNSMDFRIAIKYFKNPECRKVLVKNLNTGNLDAYAIIVPRTISTWYISQIAVHKEAQRKGIGKEIMQKIFNDAVKNEIILVKLNTEGNNKKLIDFYSSFSNIKTEIIQGMTYRDGTPKAKVKYWVDN